MIKEYPRISALYELSSWLKYIVIEFFVFFLSQTKDFKIIKVTLHKIIKFSHLMSDIFWIKHTLVFQLLYK